MSYSQGFVRGCGVPSDRAQHHLVWTTPVPMSLPLPGGFPVIAVVVGDMRTNGWYLGVLLYIRLFSLTYLRAFHFM